MKQHIYTCLQRSIESNWYTQLFHLLLDHSDPLNSINEISISRLLLSFALIVHYIYIISWFNWRVTLHMIDKRCEFFEFSFESDMFRNRYRSNHFPCLCSPIRFHFAIPEGAFAAAGAGAVFAGAVPAAAFTAPVGRALPVWDSLTVGGATVPSFLRK